jgi:hypothetical protein
MPTLVITAIMGVLLFGSCLVQVPVEKSPDRVFSMKGVGIDIPQQDFTDMKNAGISVIATEWGMEQDIGKVGEFLDSAQKAGLKVIMDGGFSYTAWGFTDDDWEELPAEKKPVWQKERVQAWIRALKDHPAIYAWDISNEFGENLPSGVAAANSAWPDTMISIDQLKQAKTDVLAIDSTRPIHARMYGWDVGKMPPHIQAMLENKIADLISLNLYSNYVSEGELQWPDVIADAGEYFVESIKQKAPNTHVWMSLPAFEYLNIFQRPTAGDLERDIKGAMKIPNLDGVSFFCWGPVNQWDSKSDWYLPKSGADLWLIIKQGINQAQQK